MSTLVLSDRCNADKHRKPDEFRLTGEGLEIHGDTLYLDGEPAAYRMEPHGLGDVHWEVDARRISNQTPVGFRRFTHIEVRP